MAEIYRREGKYSEAIVESKTAAQLSSNNPNSLADVGLTYAASGGRTHALEILRETRVSLSNPVCRSYLLVVVYSGLGEEQGISRTQRSIQGIFSLDGQSSQRSPTQ